MLGVIICVSFLYLFTYIIHKIKTKHISLTVNLMALSKYWKSPLTKNEQIKFNQYPSNQYPANSKFT